MPATVLYNGLGDGERRRHEWALPGAEADRKGGVNGQVFDEMMATGAVVAGRGTSEPAGGWGGDHHDGVPIFVLTRHEPDSDTVSGRWSPTCPTSGPLPSGSHHLFRSSERKSR